MDSDKGGVSSGGVGLALAVEFGACGCYFWEFCVVLFEEIEAKLCLNNIETNLTQHLNFEFTKKNEIAFPAIMAMIIPLEKKSGEI